jgi:IS30 family transposase
MPNVEIARWLHRDPSVISREISRNGGRSRYHMSTAVTRAEEMRRRPKERKILANPDLETAVMEGLRSKWSPRQISKRLRIDYPELHAMWVSHETIYQTLYVQARGSLRQEVKEALRYGRIQRRPRSRASPAREGIKGKVMISDRPPEVADRAVPGAWEGDLIIGKDGASQIATLVERTTRYVLLVRIPADRTAERVARLLARAMSNLPDLFKHSITWDQGREMAEHAKFTVKTGMPVYFCDPHSPWQRGSNENTNGLLRQYFPKGTDLSGYTQAQLNAVADELNDRPRETLHWLKPTEVFNNLLLEAKNALTP